MNDDDRVKARAQATLTEYERANARVFFFQAIESSAPTDSGIPSQAFTLRLERT